MTTIIATRTDGRKSPIFQIDYLGETIGHMARINGSSKYTFSLINEASLKFVFGLDNSILIDVGRASLRGDDFKKKYLANATEILYINNKGKLEDFFEGSL